MTRAAGIIAGLIAVGVGGLVVFALILARLYQLTQLHP